jgi:restriction system protein
MDLDQLVDAVIENYENMDLEVKTLLPLVKLYWPAF